MYFYPFNLIFIQNYSYDIKTNKNSKLLIK